MVTSFEPFNRQLFAILNDGAGIQRTIPSGSFRCTNIFGGNYRVDPKDRTADQAKEGVFGKPSIVMSQWSRQEKHRWPENYGSQPYDFVLKLEISFRSGEVLSPEHRLLVDSRMHYMCNLVRGALCFPGNFDQTTTGLVSGMLINQGVEPTRYDHVNGGLAIATCVFAGTIIYDFEPPTSL